MPSPTKAERDIETVRAMLEHAERLAGLGSWELRTDDAAVIWSDNLFRIFGYEPGAIAPSVDKVLELCHPDDRGRLQREIDLVIATARPRPPIEYRTVRPDRTTRHLRASTALVDSTAGARRIVGAVEDRSDGFRSEREAAAHVAVSRALSQWESLELGGARLLRNFGEAMKLDRGALWIPTGELLEARLFWYTVAPTELDRQAELEQTRLPRGAGLSGRAWEQRAPVAVSNLADDLTYAFRKEAARDGLRGAISFPAVYGDEVLAVLGFASREEVELTERLIDCLVSVGTEIGRFLSRRRGELKPTLLSTRELQVLQLAADGHPGPAIAERLQISASTVKTHFEHAYEKLEVSDRGSAVAAAMRQGLID